MARSRGLGDVYKRQHRIFCEDFIGSFVFGIIIKKSSQLL
jgi:hypothetical protein